MKLVSRRFRGHVQPGIVREVRDCAVIGMSIDRPMREEDVRRQAFEHLSKFAVCRGIDDWLPVNLSGECWFRLQNPASLLRFCGTDFAALLPAPVWAAALAFVQIKQRDVVTGLRISRDGAATGVFRVAGMAAGDDDFQFAF